MKIVRAPRQDSGFTLVRNDVLRDTRLSYRARGILVFILSHVDNWHTTSDTIASQGTEGRQAVQTAIAELRAAGYIEQRRTHDKETGRWGMDTIVYDAPRNGSLDAPTKVKKATDEYTKTAAKIVAEVWEPAVRGISTQPAVAVVNIVAASLRNGVPATKITNGLKAIAARKQTVTATRLSEVINGIPFKGQLTADRYTDWTAEAAKADPITGEVAI